MSNFFEKYPLINYRFSGEKNFRTMVDILKRNAATTELLNTSAAMESYVLQDGETPDIVSQKLYDRPDYHWIIILVNELTREDEWYKGYRELNTYIDQKYPGLAVFLDIGCDDSSSSSNEYFNHFDVGELVSFSGGASDVEVLSWDPTLSKLVLDTSDMNLVSDGESIIQDAMTVGTIVKTVSNRLAVKYFTELDGTTQSSPYTFDGDDYSSSLLCSYLDDTLDTALIDQVVTNEDYERAINIERQEIVVLSGSAIPRFIEIFESVIDL